MALDRRLAAVESMTETLPALRADLKDVSDKVTSLNAIPQLNRQPWRS